MDGQADGHEFIAQSNKMIPDIPLGKYFMENSLIGSACLLTVMIPQTGSSSHININPLKV